MPDFWGAYAIWGATGNDRQGRIWLSVTSNDEKSASAHLFQFDPAANTITDRGNVMAELERVRPRKPGERQRKIHSRIVQMPDGFMYFSSMDESGENPDGSTLPTWGGHLWRLQRAGLPWEHLASARQALIAVAGGATPWATSPTVRMDRATGGWQGDGRALPYGEAREFPHAAVLYGSMTRAGGSILRGWVDEVQACTASGHAAIGKNGKGGLAPALSWRRL